MTQKNFTFKGLNTANRYMFNQELSALVEVKPLREVYDLNNGKCYQEWRVANTDKVMKTCYCPATEEEPEKFDGKVYKTLKDIDVIGAEDVPGKYPFTLVNTANENLKQYGKEIQIVEHADEPGIYCIDVLDVDKDGNITGIDTYADNYDIDQLTELVNEAWAHVLAKVKGIGHVDPVQEIRNLWEKLDGTQKVDMMVEFFSDLLDAEKDRFLLETDNQ